MINEHVFSTQNVAYIICEAASIEQRSNILIDDDKTKTITIETILQSFNCMNWNGRIYESGLVVPAINMDQLIQCDVSNGTWYGEYGHPITNDLTRQMTIDPKLASHSIDKYWEEGNLLVARVTTLAQTYGYDMRNMILSGKPAMFSLRALGSVDLKTRKAKSPIRVVTYDSVIRPSHKEAYQRSIITAKDLSLQESAIYPITESSLNEQIFKFVTHKSENIKIACDFFDLQYDNSYLNESCNKIILRNDDKNIRIVVPIEKALNMQYSDLISF